MVAALALIFLAIAVIQRRASLVELGVAAVTIGGLSYLLSKLGNRLIDSPRPFQVTGQPALITSATDNGFPSDHTILLAALAVLVGLVSWRWGLAFLALALVVGLARVYAGVHHLIDIGGSLLVVALATGVYLLARYFWRRTGRSALKREDG